MQILFWYPISSSSFAVHDYLQPSPARESEQKARGVLFESKGLTNQAITSRPRLNPEKRSQRVETLMSEASKKTAKLREEYNGDFIPAKAEKYVRHSDFLKDIWGFQL